MAVHEAFRRNAAVPLGGARDFIDAARCQSERFFAEHVFSRLERADGPLDVQ